MSGAVIGGTIGLMLLFIAIGFVAGLVRGLKRASVHVIFVLVSILVAFFITKPITGAVLNGITVVSEGAQVSLQQLIVNQIYKMVDLSAYSGANAFLGALPTAIASPFVFIIITLVVFLIFDIIYLIVARFAFGKKKVDFQNHKPLRWYGAAIGAVECFIFLLVLCAPLTALTKTYQQIALVGPQIEISQSENGNSGTQALANAQTEANGQTQWQAKAQTNAQTQADGQNGESSSKFQLKPLPQMMEDFIPESISKPINTLITTYNNTILAKMLGSGANGGGIDKMFFDGLANMKISGVKINLRKELLGLADVYNEVAVVYSAFDARQFDNLDIRGLTAQVEGFVNRGLFRAVLADTAEQYLKTFDAEKVELPQILEEVLTALQEKITESETSDEKFDFYQFLKGDIFKLTETAEKLFEKQPGAQGKSLIADLLEVFENNEQAGGDSGSGGSGGAQGGSAEGGDEGQSGTQNTLGKLLQVVENHNEVVQTVAKDVMTLQTMKIAFKPVLNYASVKVQDYFKEMAQGEDGQEPSEQDQALYSSIRLNPDIKDWDGFVENALAAVKNFGSIMDDVSALLKGDKTKLLAQIQNIDLSLLGETLDQVRNLEILKFERQKEVEPKGPTGTNKQENTPSSTLARKGAQALAQGTEGTEGDETVEYEYVLDNILKIFGLDLLGDEVQMYVQPENGEPSASTNFANVANYANSASAANSGKYSGRNSAKIAAATDEKELQTVTLSNYSLFFEYISQSMEKVKQLGILDALSAEEVDAQTLIDTIVDAITAKDGAPEKPDLIAEALLPFYKLQKAHFTKEQSVKEMIFGLLTDNLQGVEILNFDALKNDETHLENDTYERWESELKNLGKALCALAGGTVEVEDADGVGGTKTYTYLEYFLKVPQPDMQKLLNSILEKSTPEGQDSEFKKVLSPIFEGEIFSPVVEMIYDNLETTINDIDTQIANITTVNPGTSFKAWAAGREDIVGDLEAILKDVYNTDFSYEGGDTSDTKEAFEFVGQLLDKIKTSAYNSGAKDGLLNGEFVNLVWYLTGDDLTPAGDGKYDTPPTTTEDPTGTYIQQLRAKIKEKCNVNGNKDGYYSVNFEQAIAAAVEEISSQFPSFS